MPQRYSRLRVHPIAIAGILLCLGGSTAVSWLESKPWSRWERVHEVIATRLSAGDSVTVALGEEAVLLHPDVPLFYAERMHRAAWTDSLTRATLLTELRALTADGLDPAPRRVDRLERLALTEPKGTNGDTLAADLDLLLTDAFMRAAEDLNTHHADAEALYGRRWYPASARTIYPAALLAQAFLDDSTPEDISAAFDAARPPHAEYHALREALARTLDAQDDWPTLLPGVTLEPGMVSQRVETLRRRMRIEGFEFPTPDSLARTYDETLAAAVMAFQARRGLEATGLVDQPTRTALNERPEDLIPLLTLNLERFRWLQGDLGDFHVFVNLPSFELAIRERDENDEYAEALRMNVVVGRANGWKTPVFSDTMTQVIFNPTWTIPASIQREMYGTYRGRVVQQPGPRNPMRRVKFRFPNNMGIYIHDTTSRRSFAYDERDYSHGCIRAHDPQALAETILTRINDWETEEIDAIFSGPWRQRPTELDEGVPVHLVYFTAWPTPEGGVQTFGDVYGYDAPLADALGIDLAASGG